MVVRRCTNADAGGMARLHAAAFGCGWSVEELRRMLETPGTQSWMATAGGAPEVTGFLLTRQALDECEILTLVVDTDYRRQGIARALLHRALDELTRDGAVSVFLEVAEDNAAAIALYEVLGFVCISRRKDYYLQGLTAPVDALLMRRCAPS